jgi:hypothetical protein
MNIDLNVSACIILVKSDLGNFLPLVVLRHSFLVYCMPGDDMYFKLIQQLPEMEALKS